MKTVSVLCITGLAFGQSLPDGPGKAVTERICKNCHGIENVVRAKRTKEKWAEIVDNMASRGAKGTEDEFDLVIDYLSTHFGPTAAAKVNVNKATSKDLAA